MYKERWDRLTEIRNRYMDNIYRTRRSQSDRKRIRMALKDGGDGLSRAMSDIMERKYERNTYMGLNTGG